ncbi:MAG: hypothetical protein MUP68_08955 [Deltaproteobacteria bacterium]|nr:hypothetical protein [Deltaproteobacteria bacterium]MDO8955654.1 hypothetical protein [Deltaproteobacteria bacterium]MDO9209174.1 hypothetical protein [Deltaproteobacteria bacterium]
MKKYLLGIFLVCLFPLSLWGQPPTPSPDRIITIIFSSNVYGEVEPCG